jgi:hypothetical protein
MNCKLERLVLCEYFSNGRKIKRKLRPDTVVEVACTQCGGSDFAYTRDAATHVCMDCYACDMEAENDQNQVEQNNKETTR